MDIDIKDNNDVVTAVISGDIEMMIIKEFKTKLLDIGKSMDKDIEIDLSNVDYIDSSGIGVLITLLKMQKGKGKSLKINKISPKVLDILKLSSLSDVFDL
ncbi:MAG: STAS domain-containing protein [Spirochaetota bacterium]|nr:STAS domain-containing protein [Spirochaetota bacterium]